MGQVPSACRHRHQNRQMLDTQRQDRAGKRHRLQELREQEFPSDDDDNGIWRAWGGEGELSLADGRPFSSGTEGDNSGKEFEATLREVLGLAENHLRLTRDGGLDAEVASRLQKAHRRVARDLAAVECAHIIGWNAHFKKAQLDGVGNLSKDMLQMGEWLVEPEEISGLCVAEFCINSKAFSAKLYQLGRVAEMIQAGAKWLEARPCSDDINSTDRITYLIVVDKSRPQLSPERILRRYTALNQAYEDGRFGVLYVSVTTLARALKRGSAAPAQPTVIWACQLRKDGSTIEVAGSAFKVTGAIADVDDLKKAIKAEKPNRVMCDADEIDIYSRKDRNWVKEEAMSASLRGTTEADCFGFVLPSANDA